MPVYNLSPTTREAYFDFLAEQTLPSMTAPTYLFAGAAVKLGGGPRDVEARIEAVWQEALGDATDLAVSDAAFAAAAAASPEVQAMIEDDSDEHSQSSRFLEDFAWAVAREYGSSEPRYSYDK